MKLVILDSYAIAEGDLNWAPLNGLISEIDEYPRTTQEQALERLKDADFAVCNKVVFDEALISQLPKLKWIGKIATGTDNIDIAAARAHGIDVANVPGYSTHSVAQLAFAFMLSICQCPAAHERSVRAGHWQLNVPQSFNILPQRELYGKTLGLLGFGDIAQQVAKIALAFGMKVICHTRTPKQHSEICFVSLDEMMAQSDFISLHCPLTSQTSGIINERNLAPCKSSAVVINTARGALVNESDIINALNCGKLFAYCADVFVNEPLSLDSPLLCATNVFITPHIAWATKEALERLAKEVCENLTAHLNKIKRNVVN